MVDTKAQEEPVKETQESPMPSEQEKTESPEEVKTDAPKTEEPADQSKEQTLPSEVPERTKREFEKLQTKFREERARREYLEEVFKTIQPKKEESAPPPVYDAETGYVNPDALTDVQRRAYEAEERAKRAEESVNRYLEDQENRDVYKVHPELDPKSQKPNKELHVATRRIMLDSMLNPDDYGGEQLSFMEAANRAKGMTKTSLDEAEKKGAKEALENLTPKEQASLEASGTSGRRSSIEPALEDLKRQSRKGDKDALRKRFSDIPWER